ncbi:cellulose synthase subunit BcsC-related outer membrane protein [Acidihalobacter prosperus]|uniref:Cellulose synthase operon C C-terminal domain-containing protein n=1 Tax=Acidihalobacter prosperus TaxID=160660 RepID=A0A1A6C3B7_9GAMM|nr:cellulose synthase subunit BcsC-related outer membrane protein [Acidihalobacter prosperus]OBS09053.1 hypothetical protein Thpro_021381 [Acidihalobacter prosperus]
MKRHIWMPTVMAGVLSLSAPVLTLAADPANSAAVQLLIQRAAYWQQHGREDLAVKSWRQALAADPNQAEALAGLGLYSAHQGRLGDARRYMERLQRVAPQSDAIAKIRGLLVLGPDAGPKLAEAARYVSEKRYAAAVSVYRSVFNGPPPPKWAETYYQTLAKVSGGWQTAVSELRSQVQLHPNQVAYRRVLGQLLSYHADTRIEGIKLLAALAREKVSGARSDWRQALAWMGNDPKAIPYLRAYLASYRDAELSAQLRQAEGLQAGIQKQRRHGRELADAYAALRAGHLNLADERFKHILARDPKNDKAVEGLADVAMRAQDFEQAARYYDQARALAHGAKTKARLVAAARNARYWSWMHAGQQAVEKADYRGAVNAYHQALNLKQKDPAALAALGGAYQQLGENKAATRVFETLTTAAPGDPKAWLAALQSLQAMDSPAQVISTNERMPVAVQRRLQPNLDYASVMAWAEAATDHRPQAIERLRKAIAAGGAQAPVDLQLQLAWLLYQAEDDMALHALLTRLQGHGDLTDDQRSQLRALYLNGARREAQMALENGHPEIAKAILRGAQALYPNDAGVQRVRADLLVQEGHYAEAVAIYRRVGPGKSVSGYQAAVGAALAAGETGQASRWVAEGLAQRPDDVALKSLAAKVDLQRGDADAARKALRSALATLPGQMEAEGDPGVGGQASKAYPFASGANASPAYPFAEGAQATTKPAVSPVLASTRTGVAPADAPVVRDRLERELSAIEAHMSPYVDAAFFGRSRSGTTGLDQMALFGSQFEGGTAVDYNTRVTVRLAPIAVDAGTVSGAAASLIGTAPIYGASPGNYAKASGLALAMTLSRPNLAVTLGTSPLGFLEHSLIGTFNWQPSGGPLTLMAFRHSLRDSVLSYAGIKDPKTGLVWGGVFASGLGMSFGLDESSRVLYGSLSLAAVDGKHVQSNSRVEANLGASWRIVDQERARIGIGFDLLSMFYANNSSHFTYGQGGYFSPQYYFRPALTMKWEGQARSRLSYRFEGLVGWQIFHENSSQYFPLDANMQAQSNNAYYPANTVGSVGYGLRFTGTYAWTPRLFVSGFFGSDNSQDYTNLSGGVVVRYWFNRQPIGASRGTENAVIKPWMLGLDNPGS